MTLYQHNRTKAVEFYQNRLQPKLLKCNLIEWRIQSKRFKSTKRIVTILNNKWRHQDLNCCLSKWSSFSKQRRRIISIEKQIRSKYDQNEKRDYLAEWRYKCMIIRRIKSMQRVKKTEIIKNIFVSWKVFSHQEKALRAKTTFVKIYICDMQCKQI